MCVNEKHEMRCEKVKKEEGECIWSFCVECIMYFLLICDQRLFTSFVCASEYEEEEIGKQY